MLEKLDGGLYNSEACLRPDTDYGDTVSMAVASKTLLGGILTLLGDVRSVLNDEILVGEAEYLPGTARSCHPLSLHASVSK